MSTILRLVFTAPLFGLNYFLTKTVTDSTRFVGDRCVELRGRESFLAEIYLSKLVPEAGIEPVRAL